VPLIAGFWQQSFAQGCSLDPLTNSAASWGFPFSCSGSCAHCLGT
jgi:hypothetical protein